MALAHFLNCYIDLMDQYSLGGQCVQRLASLCLEVRIPFKAVLNIAKTHPYYMQFGLCLINLLVEDDLQSKAMLSEAILEATHRCVVKD